MIQVHRPSKPILGSTVRAGMGDVFSAIGDWLDKEDQGPRLEGGHTTGPPRRPKFARQIRDTIADVEAKMMGPFEGVRNDWEELKTGVEGRIRASVDDFEQTWDDSKLGRWVDTFPDQDDWLRLKALMR